jgi:hypothetical protein
MAKMRTKALRQLHADLGKILEDYDASCAAQAKAADEGDDAPSGADAPESFQAKLHRAGRAHDAALPRGERTLSMSEAFPGIDRHPKY